MSAGFLVIVRQWARDLTFGGWRLKNGTGGIKHGPLTQGQHRQRGRPRGRWTVSFNMTERVRPLQSGSMRISTGMQSFASATGAGSRREWSYEAQMHPSDTSHEHAQIDSCPCQVYVKKDWFWYNCTSNPEFKLCHGLQSGTSVACLEKLPHISRFVQKLPIRIALIIYSGAEITLVWMGLKVKKISHSRWKKKQ